MEIDDFLKDYSTPKVHSKISNLSHEQKHKIKRHIDGNISETRREFVITELNRIGSSIEITISYSITLI